MGKKTSDSHGKHTSSVFDEELLTVNIDRHVGEPAIIADETDIEHQGFVPATPEGLNHLVPGCFVLIRLSDGYLWAEILAINGDTLVGRLHAELSNSTGPVNSSPSKAVFFRREQIRALGCERYCWC